MRSGDVGRSLAAEVPRAIGAACRILAKVAIATAKAALASSRALETLAQRIEIDDA